MNNIQQIRIAAIAFIKWARENSIPEHQISNDVDEAVGLLAELPKLTKKCRILTSSQAQVDSEKYYHHMYGYVSNVGAGNHYWAIRSRYPTIKDIKEIQVFISEQLGYMAVITSVSYMGYGTMDWVAGGYVQESDTTKS